MAWKLTGADQYSIWTTDSTGNYISSTVGAGSSATVISAETVLHQDLNNNGMIGSAAPPAGNAVSGTGTTTSTTANENIRGGNDSFVFAGNFVNNAIADVQPTSHALALDHSVSMDAALAWIHAAQTGVDGVLAADATNSVTVSQVMLAELNNHGFHLV